MKLYKVNFNDFGEDYVVADSWDEAGKAIEKFYPDSRIKEISFIALAGDKSGIIASRLHIQFKSNLLVNE